MTEEKSEQQSQTVALKYGLIVVVLIAVVSWLVMQGDEPK
jgi:heme/copper-type cytochrome/quinol oxidase subunit 4